MIWVSATANRSSKARHCGTRTAGTTTVNGWPRARATASATYDLPNPTSSASRAPPCRAMIALSRSAAGTWWGASQAGHGVAPGATAVPSSSARAALATTARGATASPGASATVRGSRTGTRCSERIRGQRAAVGSIELESIGNEIVGGLAALPAARELRPDGGLARGGREAADYSRIEAAETAARWIGDETRQRGQPAGVEQRRQRRGVGFITRGDAIDGVERHQLRCGHRSRKAPAQVRPHDTMGGQA